MICDWPKSSSKKDAAPKREGVGEKWTERGGSGDNMVVRKRYGFWNHELNFTKFENELKNNDWICILYKNIHYLHKLK